MAAVPYIWWRGKRFTPNMRDAILAAEGRAGFIFNITQGGFNSGPGAVAASAGTHDGDGGDASIRPTREETAIMVEALRWAGFAAWLRTTKRAMWGTRAQGFKSYHVHFVPNGWGAPSKGARDQAAAYRKGLDGLARKMPDLGPGHTSQWYNRTTPGKPTKAPTVPRPGLPTTGNNPTAKNPVTPTPKEDTLSAAEEARILTRIDEKFRDLQSVGLDRTGYTPIAAAVKDWPVTRDGKAIPWIQDTVNGTSNTNQIVAMMGGVLKLLETVATAQGIDVEGVADAVREAAREGVAAGGTDVATVVGKVVGEALTDLARELDAEKVARISEFVLVEVADRIGAKA